MELRKLGKNQTEIRFPNGAVVFFSYNTPVAAQLAMGGFIRTNAHYSRTTSKHITEWLEGANAKLVPQSDLDAMIGG
jgi:hypothetical protein